MATEESKALNSENQAVGSYSIKRQKKHIKPIDSNLAQSSVLSSQSSDANPLNFEQVCTELLRQGHRIKFKAPGDSMYPTICNGDFITVQSINPSDVIVGDIILYRHKSGVVAHRVVNIQEPQSSVLSPQYFFTLRGDAAPVFDNPVGADQILGKVVWIEKNGRNFNPYCFKVKLYYKVRRLALRLRRFLN